MSSEMTSPNWNKIVKYCNYQERCISDVRKKLQQIGIEDTNQDKWIERLIEKGFLDEERYARSFFRSKFNFNGWGAIKIRVHLKKKEVDDAIINKAAKEIDSEVYRKKLESIASEKIRIVSGNKTPGITEKKKLIRFLTGRGFESDLIREVLEL